MSTEQQAGGAAQLADAGVSLIDEILAESRIKPKDDGYDVAKRGVQAFIAEMLAPKNAKEKIDKTGLEAMIAEIDRKLTQQVNEILHHAEFQKLESSWRSLKYMVDRFDFRQNIKVEVLNVTKDKLQEDFEDSPEITKSGLYRIAYSNAYGVFGGVPYGMMVANFDFAAGAQDMSLLRQCASVAAMSHAPFITNASPEFFGEQSFVPLPNLRDLKSIMEGPQYARWAAFRESEDARYVGLCMPRFLLRQPYGADALPVKAFNFTEDVIDHHNRYCWGYASAAFATRVADSFGKYRWCPNIIGPQAGGAVEDLPLHQYKAMGELQTKIPSEILITERREYELAEEGFIALTYRKDSNNAAFFSASSAQRPKSFPATKEGKDAETSYKLGTQLPYTFVITRLAHYLKVMQREQIGTWKGASDLERELNRWIKQYVSEMEDPAPEVRSKRPLKQARITVEDVPGDAGWYRCSITVAPHFKYMGASFSLSMVGKLDKA
jgi:type VI secretion system protein ImpC